MMYGYGAFLSKATLMLACEDVGHGRNKGIVDKGYVVVGS